MKKYIKNYKDINVEYVGMQFSKVEPSLSNLKNIVDKSYLDYLALKTKKYNEESFSFNFDYDFYLDFPKKNEVDILKDILENININLEINEFYKALEFIINQKYFVDAVNFQNISNIYGELYTSRSQLNNNIDFLYYSRLERANSFMKKLPVVYDIKKLFVESGHQNLDIVQKHKKEVKKASEFFYKNLCTSWFLFLKELSETKNELREYFDTIKIGRGIKFDDDLLIISNTVTSLYELSKKYKTEDKYVNRRVL